MSVTVVVVARNPAVRVAVAVRCLRDGALGEARVAAEDCIFGTRVLLSAVAVLARHAAVRVPVPAGLSLDAGRLGDPAHALQPLGRAGVLEPRVGPSRRPGCFALVHRDLHGVPVYPFLMPAPKLEAVVVPPAVEPVVVPCAVVAVEVRVPVRVLHLVHGEVRHHRKSHSTGEDQAVDGAQTLYEVQDNRPRRVP